MPTRVESWQGCPCPFDHRLNVYRYIVQSNGTWQDEYEPKHKGRVNSTGEYNVWEGYGIEPGRFKARWTLQADDVLQLAWGDHGETVYWLVRAGDPRASAPAAAVENSHTYPATVVVSGAGSAEANGTYSFDPAGRPRDKDTLACHLGIYVHNTNPACWIGYQDCRKFQHADWNK